MNKKYFDTKKDSLEHKINKIASEQSSISKPVSDVKLSVEKKYFESKKGSLEDLASKLVESKLDTVKKEDMKHGYDKDGKSLAPKKEAVTQDDHGEKTNQDKKDSAMTKTDQKKDFKSLRQETKLVRLGKNGKADTGEKAAVIDLEPSAKPI